MREQQANIIQLQEGLGQSAYDHFSVFLIFSVFSSVLHISTSVCNLKKIHQHLVQIYWTRQMFACSFACAVLQGNFPKANAVLGIYFHEYMQYMLSCSRELHWNINRIGNFEGWLYFRKCKFDGFAFKVNQIKYLLHPQLNCKRLWKVVGIVINIY